MIRIAQRLRRETSALSFADPVTHVYNPLEYAWKPHRLYLERFATGPVEALFVGMNPGPYGMGQTGVPFGEIAAVREWMGIEAPVGRPDPEHPKRPIQGFACTRSEVSGRRVWTWAQEHFGTAETFFERFFVTNYCPLVFMEEGGKNRTPDKLPVAEREALFEVCDRALLSTVKKLKPEWIIGFGRFATDRIRLALEGREVKVGTVLHPSPASPMANRGWAPQADKQLEALGIELP